MWLGAFLMTGIFGYAMLTAFAWHVFNAIGFPHVSMSLFESIKFMFENGSVVQTLISSPWQYQFRFGLPIIPSLFFAVIFANGFSKQQKELKTGKVVHVRGRQYIDDTKRAAKLFAQEYRDGDGIKINPTLAPINYSKEGEHTLFVGGVGSGKTQTLIPWIFSAIDRGDGVIIHDVKGDFTTFVPRPMMLLAPWDSRSAIWNVAADVTNKAHAREFAAGLIKESQGSPMFSNAARQVLVGVIVYLQNTKPGSWSFRDVAEACAMEQPALLSIMQAFNPEGIRAVQDANVTTAGILINLSAYLAPIYDLAEAWGEPSPKAFKLSIRSYLDGKIRNKDGKIPVLILQNNKAMGEMASGLHAALLRIAAQYICSPEMPEDRSKKLWFFLDEFPQLGKIEPIGSMLDVGRSKGVRVVLLAQSLEQIKNTYGQELAKSWAALVGTMIVGRTQNETAKSIAEYAIGKREIERHTVSFSKNVGGQGGVNRSNSVSVQTVDVVMPSQLLSDLGPDKSAGGVRILWLSGQYALRLLIPFTSPQILREATQLAPWACTGTSESRIEKYRQLQEAAAAKAAEKTAADAAKAAKKSGAASGEQMTQAAGAVAAAATVATAEASQASQASQPEGIADEMMPEPTPAPTAPPEEDEEDGGKLREPSIPDAGKNDDSGITDEMLNVLIDGAAAVAAE